MTLERPGGGIGAWDVGELDVSVLCQICTYNMEPWWSTWIEQEDASSVWSREVECVFGAAIFV